MNRPSLLSFVALVLVACGGASSSPSPGQGAAPTPPAKATREALSFVAPCTASSCGEVPASLDGESTPSCGPSASTCAWTGSSDDDTVSYRQCEPSACGAEPPSTVCPAGTTFKGNQCGSENDGPCTWTTSCVPPRSTTPCAADACGPKPEIGVICADGSTGDLACMRVGERCEYQRTCD